MKKSHQQKEQTDQKKVSLFFSVTYLDSPSLLRSKRITSHSLQIRYNSNVSFGGAEQVVLRSETRVVPVGAGHH